MDRGARWATVLGVAEWDTTERLSTQQGQYGQRGQKSLDKREESKFQQV